MSLQATHIRFAIDLKDSLDVLDIDKYISGTSYPDSRYIAGIARDLTHSNNLIPDFLSGNNSFKKGWAVHLVCDNADRELFYEWFPEIFAKEGIEQGNDVWVALSAIKIVQDVEDVKYFDIQKYLPCLEYTNNPNDENIDLIKEYNGIIQGAYREHTHEPLEQRYLMLAALGASEDVVQKMREYVNEYLGNKNIMDRIQVMYNEMLKRGRDYIHNTKTLETTK